MTEQPPVDPFASTVASAAAEVLQHHKTQDVVDLGDIIAGRRLPPPGRWTPSADTPESSAARS